MPKGIPEIDLKADSAKGEFLAAMQAVGAAIIYNTPVSADLVYGIYEQWRPFFAQEQAIKRQYQFDQETQQGYYPVATELATQKEAFHHAPGSKITPSQYAASADKLFPLMLKLAETVLAWLPVTVTLGSGGEKKPLVTTLDRGTAKRTLIRVLHYPANTTSPLSFPAHADISLITFLPRASAPGLEMQVAEGEWIKPTYSKPNAIVIVGGEMLARASAGKYKAGVHRVVAPQILSTSTSSENRMALSFFAHALPDTRITPDKTADEIFRARMVKIGLLKPKARPLFVFDFDVTLTKKHVYPILAANKGVLPGGIAHIKADIRTKAAMTLKTLLKANVHVAIVTINPFIGAIMDYLREMLTDAEMAKIYLRANPRLDGYPKTKNGYIREIVKAIGEPFISGLDFYDDNDRNISSFIAKLESKTWHGHLVKTNEAYNGHFEHAVKQLPENSFRPFPCEVSSEHGVKLVGNDYNQQAKNHLESMLKSGVQATLTTEKEEVGSKEALTTL